MDDMGDVSSDPFLPMTYREEAEDADDKYTQEEEE